MLANGGDTEGLFQAAFMQSGSPIPAGDITKGQKCELSFFNFAHITLS
jgi:acetylcholinesterase